MARYGFIVSFEIEAENEAIAEERLKEILRHKPMGLIEFSAEIAYGPNELDEDNEDK